MTVLKLKLSRPETPTDHAAQARAPAPARIIQRLIGELESRPQPRHATTFRPGARDLPRFDAD